MRYCLISVIWAASFSSACLSTIVSPCQHAINSWLVVLVVGGVCLRLFFFGYILVMEAGF
jgi:hypothetical protein